ncbi:MAG: hypothetical protein ACREA0_10555 [bacterium]
MKHHALGITLLTGFAATPMTLAQEAMPSPSDWEGDITVVESQISATIAIDCSVTIKYRKGEAPVVESLTYTEQRKTDGRTGTNTNLILNAERETTAGPLRVWIKPDQSGGYSYNATFEPGPQFNTTLRLIRTCPFTHLGLMPTGYTTDLKRIVDQDDTARPNGTETRKVTWDLWQAGTRIIGHATQDAFNLGTGASGGGSSYPNPVQVHVGEAKGPWGRPIAIQVPNTESLNTPLKGDISPFVDDYTKFSGVLLSKPRTMADGTIKPGVFRLQKLFHNSKSRWVPISALVANKSFLDVTIK